MSEIKTTTQKENAAKTAKTVAITLPALPEGAGDPTVDVWVNGSHWRIMRGERAEVPARVAEALDNAGSDEYFYFTESGAKAAN